MPLASDDLPLPLTPVMQVMTPSGIRTSMLRRLFSRAPWMRIELLQPRSVAGGAIARRPVR